MKSETRNLFIEDLVRLISIKSFTGDEHGISMCFEFIEEIARRFGFCTKRCARGKVLEVFPKDLKRRIKLGIITHVDTVPFDIKDWQYNPLGEYYYGRVYGRGSIDDKLGVILSLYVLKELEDEIIPSWKLIIGSDEEGSWEDMKEYKRGGNLIPDFLFTIDGDGIQNGCRGTLNVELTFKRKEGCEKQITMFDTQNETSNIVPDLVQTQVDGSVRSFTGKAAHSSVPHLGINAICKAYDEYEEILEEEFPGFVKFMKAIKEETDGSSVFLNVEGRNKVSQQMPETLVVPTICRLKGDELVLTLNIRLSPKIKDRCQVYEAGFNVSYNYGCAIRVKEFIMPAFINDKNPEIKLMQDAYEKVVGKRRDSKIALGTGYNAAFPNAAIFGPRLDDEDEREKDLCHCSDESRSIHDIALFYDILREYIKESLRK